MWMASDLFDDISTFVGQTVKAILVEQVKLFNS